MRETLGQFNEEPKDVKLEENESGFMTELAKIAENKFAKIVLATAVYFGGAGAAMAESGKSSEDFKIKERIEKVTPDGKARYVAGEPRSIDVDGKIATEHVSMVEVLDEGDPDTKEDDTVLRKKFYRLDSPDGTTKRYVQNEFTGIPLDNIFGKVNEATPSLRAESPIKSQAKIRGVERQLQGFVFEMKIIDALKALGKADSTESRDTLLKLQGEVRDFQSKHPDVPLRAEALKTVFAK